MDSGDYSYAEGTNRLPDKTTGGLSKLAGLSFGTEEESFHSDEFDRELGRALAVGTVRRQQLKKGKDRFLARNQTSPDHPSPPDSAPTDPNKPRGGDGQDLEKPAGVHDSSKAQRNPTRPPFNNHSNTPARLASRTSRPSNSSESMTPRNLASTRRPSRMAITRFQNGQTLPDKGDTFAIDDSNISSLHQTLNDSAAFALSPPPSPEVSRRNSSNGAATQPPIAKKNATGVPKRSLASEPSRVKGAHLTLREQEKVIDEVKKENFNLKLKIYFLEDRLAKLAPDQVDLALKENVEIKVEFQTVRQELKRYKRLLLEAERAIAQAKAERDEVILQHALESQTDSPRQQDEQNIRKLESELRQVKEQLASALKMNQKQTSDLESELQRAKGNLAKPSSQKPEIPSMLVQSSQNLSGQRHPVKTQHIEDWVKEEHLLEIKNLKSELTEERQSKEDLLADHQDLKIQLLEAQNALYDSRHGNARSNKDDAGTRSETMSRSHSRLDDRDDYPSRKSATTPASTTASAHRIKDLKKDLDDVYTQMAILEEENASLRSQITAQVTMLTTRNTEKDKLQDQVHGLKRQVIELEEEVQRGDCEIEKIQHRDNGQVGDDALREELNMYRDKLASALLNLEKCEKEIDELNLELQERDAMHVHQMDKVNQECTVDLDSAKAEMDHLQDLAEEREDELEQVAEQLRAVIALQENTDKALRETNAKLEEQILEYENVLNELEATQADLKDIGANNIELVTEVEEKDNQIASLNNELDELEREAANRLTVHEQVVSKLKQKLNSTKSELNELTIQHETCLSEVKFLREKHQELALKQAEMEERRKTEADSKRRLERDFEDLERELRDAREENSMQIVAMKKEKRDLQASFQQLLDAKQQALSQAESELAHAKGRLQAREEDVEKMQSALKTVETESFRLNETQSHDRFSLELEIERLHRDLANAAKELSEAKLAVNTAHNETRSLDFKVVTLQKERDEMCDQLEQVKESRKQLNERFEEQSKTIRQAQNELASAKDRIQALEDDMSNDHKRLSKTENQYREQLSERNTLLLTIYQYIDKLVNSGNSLKKGGGSSDAKPFSNFSVFHDSVINRLRSLSAIQSGFETKIKEFESRLEKQYTALKRQHDSRMRQLDQFETTIKAATDTQRQWRVRLTTKQSEVDSARETASELQKQISSLRQRVSITGSTPGSITECKQAVNRASHLDKRLLATQAQLKTAEEKLNEAKIKVAAAEGSWQARLKELQERNRELEEKVKRERQGAKERMNELVTQINHLKEQVEISDRREKEIDSVMKAQQTATGAMG